MKVCRICNLEQKIENFDLQSKSSEKRDSRCKECVKTLKKEIRMIKSKLKYDNENKSTGYILKRCKNHGNLSYDQIRLTIREIKGKRQTYLSCMFCIKERLKLQRGDHIIFSRKNSLFLKCAICKNDLEMLYFSSGSMKEKYPKCKNCSSLMSKKSFILSKYKLNDIQHKELIARQNNLCKICGKPETSKFKGKLKRLAIDHCHKSGNVRGLLCAACNVGIGVFNDSTELLKKAIAYLEGNRWN